VERLAREGFKRIELSGGTEPYPGLKGDLFELQERFDLSYLCHNYFPPPSEPFVLNIASLDQQVRQKSIDHIKGALDLTKELGGDRFAFHAGFLLDIPAYLVGRPLEELPLFDEKASYQAFCDGCSELKEYGEGLALYVENNVITPANRRRFGKDPFFLTRASDHELLYEITGLPVLLDSGHLKVSCRALGLGFGSEFERLKERTDYFHISDNEGSEDSNGPLLRDSPMFELLKGLDPMGKVFTLEVYTGMEDLKDSFDNLIALADGSS
jgi:sugar phosphate isomerase/epimerase